jgi:HlyD family secretion protein
LPLKEILVNSKRLVLLLLPFVIVISAGAWYYLTYVRISLPPGFTSGNGRIEADEVDIATKIPARIVAIDVEEGDLVAAGQVIAQLDAEELAAQLRGAQAEAEQARQARAEAVSVIRQRRAELTLTRKELQRQLQLLGQHLVSQQSIDQLRSRNDSASAALAAAESRLSNSDAAIQRAAAAVEQLQAVLKNTVLTTPRAGRVLYRLAEPGEVLGAGGRVATVLDLSDIYMTVFLPADIAGRIAIGAPARILLDALPERAIPAQVTFVSARAQFTPKQVETRSERERMVFRVKLRVPPALVLRHLDQVKTGILGVAYVQLDKSAPWPVWLESDLTRETAAP